MHHGEEAMTRSLRPLFHTVSVVRKQKEVNVGAQLIVPFLCTPGDPSSWNGAARIQHKSSLLLHLFGNILEDKPRGVLSS